MVYASTSVEITMGEKHNDLTEIITQTLNEMKKELGDKFDIDKINLAELERRTGITRAKLRRPHFYISIILSELSVFSLTRPESSSIVSQQIIVPTYCNFTAN